MDRQEELLKFLQSKGLYEGVDLQRFKRGLMDEAKAQTLFEAMKSDGSLDADIDYDYWRDYHDIPAAQKKSQAEIQAGLGAASKPSSPLSSGVDFTAPIQDVARQTAAIAEQQRPVQTPTPQRPEMPPRTFAGREIPAPVASGREEQELVRQDVAAMQQMQANQLAQQRAQPIAQGREVFGQVQSDFPVKSGDTAIKELEQARKERQAGEKQKGIEVSPMFQDKNVPSYGKFFENTRMGKILSQGGQIAGATIAGMGAGALNLPELVANTMENISVDIAMSPYRKKLQEGKITQEQFNTYKQSARIAAQAAQKMAPIITPRQLEGLSDKYLNADELEDAARKNLKIVQERIDNSDKGFEGLIKEGRVADAFQYAATQAIGSLPYALAAAAPGGVYIVGGVTAQDKYRQIEDEVGAENMGSKETLNAIATGFVEGLSERVTKGIVDEAIEIIKGKGKVAAQKTITQKLLALAKATFGSMVSEGFSELFAKFAENIIDKATIDPNKNPSEGLLDALAIGTVSGGGITATAGTIGLAAGRRQAQAQAPGAPTAQAGAAPAPTPLAPGAPTQPPGAPAAAPTAPTRPFGPLGESAPDANVYADEILGTYRPEGGQMTVKEADRMVQDFLDTMLEVDEDEGDVKPPKPGTWEAEVYADVDARRQEIAQAVMALAATPKPTQGAPTEQAAQTPIDRLAREIYDIYGGQELTQEQANNIVDEHLASLTSKNELGETVYSAGYDQVLMAGTQIANKIVELSKQPADATQKVEQVQPQGGERQYTGAQEVQDQAATEAGIGDRAVSGGVQTEAQVAPEASVEPTAPPQEAVAPTAPTATQPEVTTPATNLEAAPTQPVQAPEGGLPEGFQQISAEEEAKQEQEEIKLRRGMAAERRKAGRYTKGSVEYVRNPIDDTSPRGNNEAIYFTDTLQQQITYKVIEADNLQSSHLGNKVNPMHFIPEAQPKDRTKGSDSVDAQQRIAFRADPNLLGQNTNAYSGAPIVNKRNEVIQGNNRSAGIKLGYGSNSFGRYRQWLIDNADQFGLDPVQIAAMKNPVLVREANVPDDRAIELGQYVAQDMESGSVRPIDSVALSTKMSDQEKAQIASIIYEDDLADVATMNEVVRAKWKKIVPIMSKHLSGGEKTFLMGRGNNISAEGVTSIIELFEQFLFDGADIDVKRIFKSTMPDKAMKAIRKSLRFIFSVPVEASLIEDMQDAFLAYGAYKKQVEAGGTKNFDLWLNNPTVFEASPSEVFSPLAIELARRFHTMQREVDLIDVFKQYAALTRVEEGGMFPGEGEAMTKADAVKQIFNVEYETRTEEEAGATGTTGDVGGQGATQLGAEQPTGAEMVEGADVEGQDVIPQVDEKDVPNDVTAQSIGIQPKNFRDLYRANRDVFGLNRIQAFVSAIAMDRMIGQMASRAGVSKEEIYKKLNFQKSNEQLLKQKPGMLFQIAAWHGSPYQIDKFSTEYIGTGEGAQAFGWGLYFTDLEDIAEYYGKSVASLRRKEELETDPIRYIAKEKVEEDEKLSATIIEKISEANILLTDKSGKSINLTDYLMGLVTDNYKEIQIGLRVELNGISVKYEVEKEFPEDDGIALHPLFDTMHYYGGTVSSAWDTIDYYAQKQEIINFIERIAKGENISFGNPNIDDAILENKSQILRILSDDNIKKIARNQLIIGLVGEIEEYGGHPIHGTFLDNKSKKSIASNSDKIVQILKDYFPEFEDWKRNEFYPRKYRVTLFRGKTPKEYNLLDWFKPADKYSYLLNELNEADRQKYFPNGLTNFDDGERLYTKLSRIFGDYGASKFLLLNGVDGVKYPAESRTRDIDKARGFNYVVFDDNAVSIEEVIKFQKDAVAARGAAMVSMDGNATVYALTSPNVSTPLHELAHVYEHYMTDAERKTVVSAAGTQGWTTETSEYFARGFERYLAEGVAPTSALQRIFEKFKQWLTDIYNGIAGSAIDVQLNDEMRRIYAQMLGVDTLPATPTVAEPTPQPIAPPAPVNQTGTLRNPHTKKLYPNRPAGKFLDVSLVSEAELAGFLKAKTPEAKQKLKAQFKTAKRLQKIADMLGVKVYYGDGTTFGKGEAGTTSTSRSDSDPVQRAIYINFEAVKDGTLSHELAHAFLSRSWGKNSETMSNQQIIAKIEQTEKEGIKLKNRLVAILKDSGDADLQKLSNDIEAWAKMYPAHLRGEEYVVELAARLSEGMRDKIVDNSILAKIERAINAFFDALLGKDQIQVRLTDTKDLIDFINTLSKGVVDGDAKSIDAALELYESGRVTNPRKTIYWKKQEIKDGKAFVRELTNKINAQDNFDTVKDIESIVNKILTQVFSPGRYIVKFNSAADAAGFVENLNIGAKADNKNSIKISKDVAADMAVAINDHLSTILDRKQQIATDLTPEENADMERFTEMFPPVRGITPEPTADETRVIEKLQAEQVKSEETFGKMINAVTVAPVANQDAIAGKPDNTKMRMVQDRTGVIPNGLAGQLTVSGSPHGMHGMFSTVLSKMRSVQRQGVSKLDAAKAIFAQAFDGKAVHAYTFFDKVRIIDPALITTEKEGGKEYYMFNGSGAASILLNSEPGQTFLQDLSEGRRNAEFEAQAAEIISLYGIDPTTFFNRVYAAQTAFGDGNIAAAEKALNNGRSLIAAITGIGTLTKQEARALENAIINDGALPVKTTGNDRLDSRADAMALALNMDKGVARNILYHLVGKHLTSPLDQNAVDDAIDLSDMEFYPQLSMLTDSDYDNGFERLSFQRVGTGNMHNYTSLPFYNQARDFVARELDKGTFDKDIVAALSRMYPTHLTGFDAKDFFEGIAGRPYRSRVGMDDVSAAVFKLIRHAYRMQWGNAKMELSNIRSFLRDRAYSYDYSIGNDLAPIRQIQRDVEKYLGYLLPKESAAYQKMQLYTSASAFKIDKFTNRFYGDRKALREGKFTDSFISRLAKSAVGSVNEFNTFLVNMHRWERIDRAIDIQERFLSNMYNELASIAQGLGITVQPLGATFDAATARREIAAMLAAMNAGNIKSPATKLKINRFTEELASLDQAVGLRDGTDGIVDRFQQYVRSKGINPAGLKPQNLETRPEFADHFTFLREFKGMQIEYLDILRDAGHLNDERYNHLKNGTSGESDVVWDYYTPLVYDEFAFRDEMGFPPTLAESKVATFKIFGISLLRRKRGNVSPVLKKGPITVGMLDLSNLESPVEVFFHRMASAIKFKERNDAINSLANMLEQTGSNKYANFAARYSIQKDRWGTITSANDLIPDRVKNQSVTYYKDGKRRYLYFADPNDPMLAKLNKGFDDFTMWEQFWRHTNNFARAAFTYMNPGFIEASLFRDVMEAGVNIMVESRGLQINNFKAKLGKNFVKYYAKSSKFFLAPMFAKDPEMAKYYQEIQELGGFMSWSFDSMELLEDAEAKVKDNIAYAERYAQGRTKLENLRMLFTNSLDALTAISNRVEMMPRLATYASLRQMGIDPIRAAEAAKNITVNFEKKGASNIIRRLSVYYLFLNPSIQGVRKFGKQLYSPEGRKYLLAYAAATAAARGLLYMMPYLAGDDEEERKRIAEKIDRYIYDKWASDTKVLLPNPLDPENPFTAPKPYNGFRLASAAGEGMVDMYVGKKTSADVTQNIIGQVKGAFDPIAGTSSYFNQWIDAMPLPLFHPVFEAVANIDYQGRPILFDQSGAFDYLKANKSTSQIYHTIAQGVYRHTPGHIDISPTSYEHVTESYFKLGPSRIINNLVKAGNNLTDPESGKTDAERQKHFLKEVISANRVLYNPNISEDDKRDLYNYLSMSSAKMGSWNEEKVKYAERAIVLTKQKMLVNPKVIQDSLDDLLSQIVFSGKLYQKVPGQEITWAQWYSAMSSIGDKRSAAQHKRYINDKIIKALEESGNQAQEE